MHFFAERFIVYLRLVCFIKFSYLFAVTKRLSYFHHLLVCYCLDWWHGQTPEMLLPLHKYRMEHSWHVKWPIIRIFMRKLNAINTKWSLDIHVLQYYLDDSLELLWHSCLSLSVWWIMSNCCIFHLDVSSFCVFLCALF